MISIIQNELIKFKTSKKLYVTLIIAAIISITRIKFLDKLGGVNIDGTMALESFMWGITVVISYWIIVLIGEEITDEFKNGTMKLSLVNPITRTQYFIAKIIYMTLITLALIILYFSFSMIYSLVVYGEIGINDIVNLFGRNILIVVPVISFGIVISIVAMVVNSGSNLVVSGIGILMFFQLGLDNIKYLKDFNLIRTINEISQGQLIYKNLGIDLIYFVIAFVIANILLKQKEIR